MNQSKLFNHCSNDTTMVASTPTISRAKLCQCGNFVTRLNPTEADAIASQLNKEVV